MKQIFNITSTDANDTPQQVLSIRIGERHFGFSISRYNTDELLHLSLYTTEGIDENVLREIYIIHPELHHSYYKTIVCYDNSASVLVPDKYYRNEDDSKLLIESMHGKLANSTVVTEGLQEWSLKNVYALSPDIEHWMKGHFPSAEYHHTYSIGIKQINATDFEGSFIIDIGTDNFLLIVSQARKLLLAQSFAYTAPADVLYYLLKACKEYSLSQETVRLAVSGLIEKQSALYKELYQYFLNIRFRDADWRVPYAEEQYPAHFFTSFNDLALCAS
ncbi:MAG: DUF3822 family protein [Chitinophagaceae bacterium]